MLFKTHIAFAILGILLFIGHVNNKIVFSIMVLLSTIVADIDSENSFLGRFFKPLNFFVKHRGIVHSLFFVVFISIILAVYFPITSFGFFLGFSIHLICDSFTKDGIEVFWPFKTKVYGFVTTGGKIEKSIFAFVIFLIAVYILLGLLESFKIFNL